MKKERNDDVRIGGFLVLCIMLLAPDISAAERAPEKEKALNLAFVLLSQPTAPKGEEIERAFASFAIKGQRLHFRPGKARKSAAVDPLEFEIGADGTAFVALTPTPVPNHEADDAVRYSVSALGDRWKLGAHKAHLVVTSREGTHSAETLSSFTSLVAAVAQASSAVGIYCGSAGATHDPKFFEAIARERDTRSRLVLWNGVAIARAPDGRLSLMSLGMKQLDLPDLLLVVPVAKSDEALGMAFDLLGSVVHSGKPVAEGDTVGRNASERMPVHYVRSPVDPKAKVWLVDLK
jgi:hypothetical protein